MARRHRWGTGTRLSTDQADAAPSATAAARAARPTGELSDRSAIATAPTATVATTLAATAGHGRCRRAFQATSQPGIWSTAASIATAATNELRAARL